MKRQQTMFEDEIIVRVDHDIAHARLALKEALSDMDKGDLCKEDIARLAHATQDLFLLYARKVATEARFYEVAEAMFDTQEELDACVEKQHWNCPNKKNLSWRVAKCILCVWSEVLLDVKSA